MEGRGGVVTESIHSTRAQYTYMSANPGCIATSVRCVYPLKLIDVVTSMNADVLHEGLQYVASLKIQYDWPIRQFCPSGSFALLR